MERGVVRCAVLFGLLGAAQGYAHDWEWWRNAFSNLTSTELPPEGVFYSPNQVWCNKEKQSCSKLVVDVWKGFSRAGVEIDMKYALPVGILPGFNPERGIMTTVKSLEDDRDCIRVDFNGTALGFPQSRFYEMRVVQPGQYLLLVWFRDPKTAAPTGSSDVDLVCTDDFITAHGACEWPTTTKP
eukprot:Hpha_TRINITY_DN34592_c0_g1::TRINITY_DN34592_c0_g1_i1::g.96312::m.96312